MTHSRRIIPGSPKITAQVRNMEDSIHEIYQDILEIDDWIVEHKLDKLKEQFQALVESIIQEPRTRDMTEFEALKESIIQEQQQHFRSIK